MNPIDTLPDLPWTDWAQREIAITGEQLISASYSAYQVEDLFVFGLIYDNLTAPPWLWFALTKNVRLGDLRRYRFFGQIFPVGTLTMVHRYYETGHRFARFCGFERVENVACLNRDYLIFRRV